MTWLCVRKDQSLVPRIGRCEGTSEPWVGTKRKTLVPLKLFQIELFHVSLGLQATPHLLSSAFPLVVDVAGFL